MSPIITTNFFQKAFVFTFLNASISSMLRRI